MLKVSGTTPTPSGHEWKCYCSVGVDCSEAEPRCIWMVVLRCLSPSASPRRIPITSTQHQGSQRHVKHHRSTLVRGKTFIPTASFLMIQYVFIAARIAFWLFFFFFFNVRFLTLISNRLYAL